MSYADQVFIQTCQDILSKGVWDTDRPVRPRWEDGTSAHTIRLFGVVNRYDLRKEFPIITVRKQFLKSAVDELLWIWQKKSNDVHQLSSHIWDAWADENGTIGKAYGYQLGVKHHYPRGIWTRWIRCSGTSSTIPAPAASSPTCITTMISVRWRFIPAPIP